MAVNYAMTIFLSDEVVLAGSVDVGRAGDGSGGGVSPPASATDSSGNHSSND